MFDVKEDEDQRIQLQLKKAINTKRIMLHWDTISGSQCHSKERKTTQATLVRKLSGYKSNHPTPSRGRFSGRACQQKRPWQGAVPPCQTPGKRAVSHQGSRYLFGQYKATHQPVARQRRARQSARRACLIQRPRVTTHREGVGCLRPVCLGARWAAGAGGIKAQHSTGQQYIHQGKAAQDPGVL